MSEACIPADRLRNARRRQAGVLWVERLLPALAPCAGILMALLSAALLGLTTAMPPPAQLALLTAVIAGAAGLAIQRVRRLAHPRPDEIDRRLEQRAGALHRPLATLSDRPAWQGAEAVWREHRNRARTCSSELRAGAPAVSRKLLAGSAATIAALVASTWLAGAAGPDRLRHALLPFEYFAAPPLARLQAWIVPPPSTGLAPIFLQPADTEPHTVPLGSHLFVSMIGAAHPPVLSFTGRQQKFHRLGENSFQAELMLTASGSVQVRRGLHRIAHWTLQVIPDQPPTVRLAGAPSVAAGRAVVPWQASDDFGIASIHAVLTLPGVLEATAQTLNLPIDSAPRSARGGTLPDLADNPWAGLPVHLHWVVTDTAGQHGDSAEAGFILPERVFLNPLARTLQDIRRSLVQRQLTPPAATTALDRLSVAAAHALPTGQWLNLRATAALLTAAPNHIDEAAARLWRLALALEDAGVTDAKQRLADLRARLRDALAAPPSPAQRARAEALTQALKDSIRSYLQALALRAAGGNSAPPGQPDANALDASQVVQMAGDLADTASAGRNADAELQLQRLGTLLDSLQSAQPAQPGSTDSPKGAGELGQLAIDQDHVRDHTALGLPELRRDLAAQQALRNQLGKLLERLGDANLAIPDALARADSAMRDAAKSLSDKDASAANTAQRRAADALRAGAQQLAKAGSQDSRAATGGQQTGDDDPFGRGPNSRTAADPSSTAPLDADTARSRPLRDELRRRAAERDRRPQELDYLGRLLKSE